MKVKLCTGPWGGGLVQAAGVWGCSCKVSEWVTVTQTRYYLIILINGSDWHIHNIDVDVWNNSEGCCKPCYCFCCCCVCCCCFSCCCCCLIGCRRWVLSLAPGCCYFHFPYTTAAVTTYLQLKNYTQTHTQTHTCDRHINTFKHACDIFFFPSFCLFFLSRHQVFFSENLWAARPFCCWPEEEGW